MKGFIGLTAKEKEDILKKHTQPYDGYATMGGSGNMYPLTVYNNAKDSDGITLNNQNNATAYKNHKINEIAAKNLHYDEIDPAYEFDSDGPGDPNLGYDVYNQTKKAYDFDSQGPADPYYGGGTQPGDEDMDVDDTDDRDMDEIEFDTKDFDEYVKETSFEDLLDDESLLDKQEDEIEEIHESISKTKDMFKRFKNFN
jgi:hypothetical protein